jgi:hypothetical protein
VSNEFPASQGLMSPAGYSVSVVYIIGQFLKVDSTLLEARTAARPKAKICSYILCCCRIKQFLLVRFRKIVYIHNSN